jgi:hypothetical protein
VGQAAAIRADLMGVGELYKIHGSATDPNSLVLTRRDFDKFHARSPYFAIKALGACTGHTFVFLGSSPTDNDVVALMSSIAACLADQAMRSWKDRLLFVELDPRTRAKHLLSTTLHLPGDVSLTVLVARVRAFQAVFGALGARDRTMAASDLRRLKQRVHQLVLTSDRQSLQVQGTDAGRINETDVFGVGTIAQLRTNRYRGLRRIELLRDLVQSDAGLDPAAVLEGALPSILRYSCYTPGFKYLRGAGNLNNGGELRRDARTVLDDRLSEYVSQEACAVSASPVLQTLA